ncbi:hypothetical protein [Nostoc sp. PCC 9305]|uniref:hypothetical protein n=1 Tax=Nostoc sp. PCC 9305 TaxID=296636 RepID=UPI0039C64D39
MLENKEVNKFTNYLDSISTDSSSGNLQAREELKKISREYKNKSESGLLKIEEIGKTHNFSIEEVKKLVSEFIKFEYSEPGNITPHFYDKKDDGNLVIYDKMKLGSFDQYIHKLLKDLDQDFLKSLYKHLGGNPYHLKENL